jgi:hypothetical protein
MKCISFLGAGNYSTTVYYYGDSECETNVIQQALNEIFNPEEIILFTTDYAEQKNLDLVLKKLENIRVVKIPDGKREEEHWEIFDLICNSIDCEEIICDITHALRSIPFISFLTIAYLKEIKDITIGKIVYGAFEAKDDKNRTPILDLTSFSAVLDWMIGVRDFIKFGNAGLLSELLKKSNDRAYREDFPFKPKKLKNFSDRITEFSNSVNLLRPIEALNLADKIDKELLQVEKEIENLNLKPVTGIMEKIREISKIAYSGEELDPKMLGRQLELIKYQMNSGLYLQAVEFLREWIINYLILALDYEKNNWLSRDVRETVEKTLGASIKKKSGEDYHETILMERFEALALIEEITKTWSTVSTIRNDLAHCGMNENRIKANKIRKIAEELIEIADNIIKSL